MKKEGKRRLKTTMTITMMVACNNGGDGDGNDYKERRQGKVKGKRKTSPSVVFATIKSARLNMNCTCWDGLNRWDNTVSKQPRSHSLPSHPFPLNQSLLVCSGNVRAWGIIQETARTERLPDYPSSRVPEGESCCV